MQLQKHTKLSLAALFAAMAFMVSACANIPTAAPADDMSEGPIEITILDVCAPVTTPILDQLTARFQENHPDAVINVECSQGDYAEGIYAKAAAGNLPDIMFSADLFTVPFVNNGVLLDMEELANSDDSFTFDDIYPNILGLGQVVGTPGTYMIPASWDSVQMYYNKDMFTAAGASLPEDDWTWDDLLEACQTIQAQNEGIDCVSIGGSGGWDWWAYFIPWVEGYGGRAVSEDFSTSTFSSPEALAGIQAYVDMWNEHDVMMPLGVDIPGGGQGCFIGQNCATFFHIPGLMKTFREQITDFEWDVSITP
ncbi:MAG: extracellular solute-binding protein, partial [Chloroflexota bacterium]